MHMRYFQHIMWFKAAPIIMFKSQILHIVNTGSAKASRNQNMQGFRVQK